MKAAFTSRKIGTAVKVASIIAVPSVPISAWWYSALKDREAKAKDVQSRVRIPNVQTVDDLMIEKCQPGDVILFDRRCHKCAAGPTAAFSCILNKTFLCSDNQSKTVNVGKFEHAGIIVPGDQKNKLEALDPLNLLLLESTPHGIVARKLSERLEMTQSRTVLWLPLASPGERRNDDDYEPSPKTKRMQDYMHENLSKFRDTWVEISRKQNYGSFHSSLGIIGSLAYALGLYKTSKSPISPSAFLVVSALTESGAGLNLSDRVAFETKVEDFLRDHRFAENDVVRLRPGWKFLSPVIMRETSRS